MSGSHTLRAGYDYRLYKELGFGTGAAAGQYDFGSNYTRQLDNSPAAVTGQQFAAFLLGQPTGGTIDRNAERLNYSPYHGLWFQDDWKISDKLSVNLGVRYEYEGATYDSENRNVRGWDPTATLSITSAAQAAYAATPIPEVPRRPTSRCWAATSSPPATSERSGTRTRTTGRRASAGPTG